MKAHILSTYDLEKGDIVSVLDRAGTLQAADKQYHLHTDRILGLIFTEPSVRTRLGFHAAMLRLGGQSASLDQLTMKSGTSAAESLQDILLCIEGYCDALVIRHPDLGSLRTTLTSFSTPLLGVGDAFEHPTQPLIDLFAIQKHLGRLEELRIGVVGRLSTSRCTRSLLIALRHFEVRELRLMAPAGHNFDLALLDSDLRSRTRLLPELCLDNLDVLYVAGLPPGTQQEIASDQLRASFRLTRNRLSDAHPSSPIVICPMPRIDEIELSVDALIQAKYFQQSRDALFVRMALLDTLFSNSRIELIQPSRP